MTDPALVREVIAAPGAFELAPKAALELVPPPDDSGMTAADLSVVIGETTDGLADPQVVADLLDLAAADGPEGYARLMHRLAVLQAAARVVSAEVEAALLDVLPSSGQVTFDGIGTFEAKGGTKRTDWDDELLLGQLFALAIAPESRTDPETGEVTATEAEAVRDVLRFAGRLEWRVTALRKLGIDPDRYCEKSTGPRRVKATWAERPTP